MVSVLQTTRAIEVLLVEDDLGDVELTKEAIEEARLAINLNVVRDGNEAMIYLRREGVHTNAVRTDLVLLDLNMPRKDGREVLRDLRNDPNLTHIPVVILTTSDADEDILNSYDLGANCYVTKPVGLEQFMTVVQSIRDFWLMLVELPVRE